MFKKSIPCKFALIAFSLLSAMTVIGSSVQAATISMTSNNNYFAGWVWDRFPIPPNTAYCPLAGSVPSNTVMQGLLSGQPFTVTEVGQPATSNWRLCAGNTTGTNIPSGTGLPSAVDQVKHTAGDLLLQSSTPLPNNSLIAFVDIDFVESAHLTFRDCSGNAIDPVNFDTLVLSSDYVAGAPGSNNQPMATSTYVPAAGGNPPQWLFQSSGTGNVPDIASGLLMHSASICSIEINSPVQGASGGYSFYLGTPGPIISVAKSLDPATATPVQANQAVIFDLTVSNAATSLFTQQAGYQFYEVVPQGTTFASIGNATTDCAPGAAAGTLCTITVSAALAPGTSQVIQFTVNTPSTLSAPATLPAGSAEIFNIATHDTIASPSSLGWGCTTSGSVCQFPPSGPTCPTSPSGVVCASAPLAQPAITLAKTVDPATPAAVGPGQDVVFDLTATNAAPGTSGSVYQIWEIVPQNTVFKSVSSNAAAYCGAAAINAYDPSLSVGAPAGTLCIVSVSDPIAYGTPLKVQFTVTTVSPLPVGTTSIFNAATQFASDPGNPTGFNVPSGCTLFDATGAVVMNCTNPPMGPSCPSGSSCASVPMVTTLLVTKTVSGGPAAYGGNFRIALTCIDANGNDGSAMLTPSATQTVTAGTGNPGTVTFGNVRVGDTCTVSEGTLPTPPTSYSWGTPTITQSAAIAASGSMAMVTNILNGSSVASVPVPAPMLDWKWLWCCVALLAGIGIASGRRRRFH